MRVLAVNAGSTSLKLALLEGDEARSTTQVDLSESGAGERALREALADADARPDAVGHRVVHGGGLFDHAVRIDRQVRARLEEFTALAPLHQPASLAGIDLVTKLLPDVPAVACFDTAFHATLPAAAASYALPTQWREEYGLRRFGFHGLSHAYAARRSAELVGRPVGDLRTVVCHLGAGASLAAVRAGESVDTTMGFTPIEGLVMASRSGSVDPGLLVWLLRNTDLTVDDLDDALQHDSGLKGLAGTSDMRQVLERASTGDPAARLALDVYVHRLRSGIAAMAASLGGLDVLTFTGGVGEHAPEVRARAVRGLAFLGVGIEPGHNAAADGDCEIGAAGSPVRCLVVAAREDLEIATETRRVLGEE